MRKTVQGIVQIRLDSGLYTTRDYKKVFYLPEYVLPVSKPTTLFTQHGHLIIEFPIMNQSTFGKSSNLESMHSDNGGNDSCRSYNKGQMSSLYSKYRPNSMRGGKMGGMFE